MADSYKDTEEYGTTGPEPASLLFDEGEASPYKVEENKTVHAEIVRLHFMGYKPQDIAATLKLHQNSVKSVLASQESKVRLLELGSMNDCVAVDIREEINLAAAEAIKCLRETINGTMQGVSPKLKAEVSMDILDRAGHSKVSKIEGKYTHGMIGELDLAEVKLRANRISKEMGTLVMEDAIPVEVS